MNQTTHLHSFMFYKEEVNGASNNDRASQPSQGLRGHNFCYFEAWLLWPPPNPQGSALVALEQVRRDDQPLDLTGAFVNLGDAGITVVPLDRHLCHVAHATQDLNGLRWKAEAQEGERRGQDQLPIRTSVGRGSWHALCSSTSGPRTGTTSMHPEYSPGG